MVIRSFGLLCDYVESFDIVLADGEQPRLATVWKPDRWHCLNLWIITLDKSVDGISQNSPMFQIL